MSATADQIIRQVRSGNFSCVYFLCGEETYYIDQVEQSILEHAFQPGEQDFNLDVLYSKDIQHLNDVMNACQAYPAFATRRVVVLREAQHIKKADDWAALELYLKSPMPSTVLVICYKGKTPDKRTSFYKSLEKNAVLLVAEKMKEQQLPSWIASYIKSRGFQIADEAAQLLADNLGNDIARIVNELDKLDLALEKGAWIDQKVIEQYIGISRDYNSLELSNAVQDHNVIKAVKIIKYFEQNPKAGPPPLIVGTLYAFFIKLWLLYEIPPEQRRSDAEVSKILGVSPYAVPRFKASMRHYSARHTSKAVAILSEYDARSKGINNHMTPDHALMTELIYKLMHEA
jgi:DNA polymerase III subunit delta